MSIFFVLPTGLGMGLYLRKREDGFPLTTGGNDPVEEDRCYYREGLPIDTGIGHKTEIVRDTCLLDLLHRGLMGMRGSNHVHGDVGVAST